MTRSPTHEAWAGVAVLPEVRYHVHIVRKVTGTSGELWIAREVRASLGTVSVRERPSNDNGKHTQTLKMWSTSWHRSNLESSQMKTINTSETSPSARYTRFSAAQAKCV